MLERLHIKNIALIEETEIAFAPGLNILTGETGAGKSMVIDAVNFVLGERSGRSLLRQGAEKAQVEAFFTVTAPETLEQLCAQGVEIGEDGELLVVRSLSASGKTVNRLNGSLITATALKQACEGLLDVHGQHEHQSLLHPAKHLGLLDRFCGEPLTVLKGRLSVVLDAVRENREALRAIPGAGERREEFLDLLRFQWEELSAADLKEGEEEELAAQRKRLANGEKLQKLAAKALRLLDGEGGAAGRVGEALGLLSKVAGLDETAAHLDEGLETALAALDDVTAQLREYGQSLDIDSESLSRIEERLDVLYRLKRKYGGTLEAVIAKREDVKAKLEEIENAEERRTALLREQKGLRRQALELCTQMTDLRREQAGRVQGLVEAQLHDLSMPHARFVIDIRPREGLGREGRDKVEFLIAPNLGQELTPLAKIASGGEMSRVMLAIKVVLGAVDSIETYIFDEIDAGVSGRAAQRVGEKLAQLGQNRQVICVTHLPQIAARADAHFHIEKTEGAGRTVTGVTLLDPNGAVEELARLMGGDVATPAILEAARELKAGL